MAFIDVSGQQTSINYSVTGKSLSTALGEIADRYSLKFAFNTNSFDHISATFEIRNATTEELLKLLETKFAIQSRNVDGTWILVRNENNLQQADSPGKTDLITVNGFVKDKITGENLLYCNVMYENGKGTVTNDLGFFNFQTTNTEKLQIAISHLGYQILDTIISTKQQAKLYLTPSEILMPDIVVTQVEKNVLEASSYPEKIGFNPLKSANIPRLADDDLGNALLLIPGVSFSQGNSAGISIRGSTPTDNLVLFDGIPVLETSHLLGNMSVLNAKYVQQAFVSRGGFDARFGGRVAGLIELTGKSGKNYHPYLDVSGNLMNSNVLANVPITKKISVTAAWRRSYIDTWQNFLYMRLIEDVDNKTLADNTISSSIIPTIKYQDINSKLSFHPSDDLEINMNVLYGSDHQSRDYELVNTKDYYRNEYVNSKNLGLSLNMNWQINEFWYSSLNAGYSKLDRENIEETGELEEYTEVVENPGQGKGKGKGLAKTKEETFTRQVYDIDDGYNDLEEYRIDWKSDIKTGIFTNQAGIGWTANSFNYRYFANRTKALYPIDSVVNAEKLYLLDLFVQQYIQITDQIRLRWGLRSNLDLESKKFYLQPRGGVEYNTGKGFTVNFSGGVYHQFLTSSRRIDSEGHYNYVWYLPNSKGAGVVKAENYLAGIKLDKKGWLINIESYLNNVNGKLNLFAIPSLAGGELNIRYSTRVSNERKKGVDVLIQKKQGMLNHMIGYSLSKSEENMDGVLDKNWYISNIDRLHQLKINEMFSWKNWSLTGSWNFATGLPVINLTDNNTLQNIERTDNFYQLDFSLVKKIYTPHFVASAGLTLLNVFNRKNIVEVDYLRFTSDTGSLTVRSDVSALGFTPVFFLNLKVQ
jgi:ferric enterobactin receptor